MRARRAAVGLVVTAALPGLRTARRHTYREDRPMSNPSEGDRAQAVNVWQGLRDDWRDPIGVLAEAFADARAAGRREVIDRLGPIIADAEVARQEIADEVYA